MKDLIVIAKLKKMVSSRQEYSTGKVILNTPAGFKFWEINFEILSLERS